VHTSLTNPIQPTPSPANKTPNQLTLWDKHVTSPGQELEEAIGLSGKFPVLAAKGVRVGDFNGKNLSTLNSTTVGGKFARSHVLAVAYPAAVGWRGERAWIVPGGSSLSQGGWLGSGMLRKVEPCTTNFH
jgi:hypothetical protein